MAEIESIPSIKAQDSDQIVDSIIQLARKEQKRGNKSITQEKLDNLSRYVLQQKSRKELARKLYYQSSKTSSKSESVKSSSYQTPPFIKELPPPQYSPLFSKFNPRQSPTRQTPQYSGIPRTYNRSSSSQRKKNQSNKKLTFKSIERIVIEVLETLANILDNLHLFSKLPMFPKPLLRILKQTNKLWVLILIFLIRKTISQLLNVIRKEKKVAAELSIVKKNGSKLLEFEDELEQSSTSQGQPQNIFKKYEKVMKDLKFDKTMLIIELIGNFLDLSFNTIELYGIDLPDWFMGGLNAASMFMTIYRMNKDDEYIDDDITEDLI